MVGKGLGMRSNGTIIQYKPMLMRGLQRSFLSMSLLIFLNNVESSYEKCKEQMTSAIKEQLLFAPRDEGVKKAREFLKNGKD